MRGHENVSASKDANGERKVPMWYLRRCFKYESGLGPVVTVVGKLPFLCYILFHTLVILQRKKIMILRGDESASELSSKMLPVVAQSRSHVWRRYLIVQKVSWEPPFPLGNLFTVMTPSRMQMLRLKIQQNNISWNRFQAFPPANRSQAVGSEKATWNY